MRRAISGKLRESVDLYSMTRRRDIDTGAMSPPVWTAGATDIPAAVVAMPSAETAGGGEVDTRRRFEITIRGGLAVSEENRIGWGSRWFNVAGVRPDVTDTWIVIDAIEELKEAKP